MGKIVLIIIIYFLFNNIIIFECKYMKSKIGDAESYMFVNVLLIPKYRQ